jgi:hypothetical protein
MSDEDPPPPLDSVPPESGGAKDGRRRRLEGVIPELVRRAVEIGVEKAQVAPENLKQFVGEMKLPKEIAGYLFHQIDETKNGLFRVVAKELRDFLEQTNFAGEIQKLLTTVQFEVNTTIRFTPNDKKTTTKPGPEPSSAPSEEEVDGDDAPSAAEASRDEAEPPRRPSTLPKPEVRTAVHVRRDDRRRRDRAT